MASEDLFEPEYSEEIIAQVDQEFADASQEIIPLEEEEEDDAATTEKSAEQENKQELDKIEANKDVNENGKTSADNHEAKLFSLPMSRIRNLMKLDPDMQIASNEAVFTVTKATELFIQSLARESYSYTTQAKKKTVQKKDVDMAISAVDSLMFLDGAMNI